MVIKTKADIPFAAFTDVCGQIQIDSNGYKGNFRTVLAIAFSDCLMPNRESNSSLVSLLNAEEHVSRKEAIKLSFLAIRKYLDFLDSRLKNSKFHLISYTFHL